jgi:hypothetical protein
MKWVSCDRVPRAAGSDRVVARRRQRARPPQRPDLSVRRKINGLLVSQALPEGED